MPEKILKVETRKCRIVERLSKFSAIVEFEKRREKVYVNNTGRLLEYFKKRRVCFCSNKRLIAIKDGKYAAIIDTSLQMRTFEKALEMQLIPWLKCYLLKRNVRVGESIIDYLLKCGSKKIYLEIKSAVMHLNGYASYPDCLSKRGRKHVKSLMSVKNSILLFIAAIPNAIGFKFNRDVDLEMAKLLEKANFTIKAIGMFYNPKDNYVYLYNPNMKVLI